MHVNHLALMQETHTARSCEVVHCCWVTLTLRQHVQQCMSRVLQQEVKMAAGLLSSGG